ncbi:SpoIIE family protein phosphatase [Streptomyces sp. RTd22]|uniref:SpoIIE family protein phosphatase n=1 Tax=Streptomyces sp. RTd22 TaxID=1841249 RepID=UPI001F1BD1B1|nr:SpoIIE family protein phosphatase [Streptomyces sp. RTd22]
MAEQDPLDQAGTARLRTIITAGDELGDAELLGFALDLAVTESDGLGGMVHLRGPVSPGLLLMAVHGLARTVARHWEKIEETGVTAPARAVAGGVPVWAPADTGTARGPALPAGCGLLAVPLVTPGGVAGVLSVLTDCAQEPTQRQRESVETLAAWTALRLREHSPTPWPAEASGAREDRDGEGPARQEPPATRLRQALKALRVGSWEWNLATGELVWDEPTLTLFGMDPGTPKQPFENWTAMVHPDDLPWVLVEAEQAIRHRRVFSVEYRICRPDGTTSWASARGRVLLGQDGQPAGMVGTVCDTTESRIARDAVNRALRHMSDAFLAVDSEWRITFVNVEAERLLGTPRTLHGRTLWDVFARLGVDAAEPGLEAHCRQAADSGAPVEFEVRWPANERWYHMRLVPVPEGLTVYATDVTERRSREEERAAAERAAAERTARITELTNALAEALTMQDVVKAIAERVLRPFGASGLVVQLIEGEVIRVAGAVGYPRSFLDSIDGSAIGEISPIAEVYYSRTPAFIGSAEEYTERYPAMAWRPAAADKAAWAFLPLTVSGHCVGCSVISFTEPRHLNGEERALLTALSGLMAQAIERARLYDTEHNRAKELQRGLLPRTLPSLGTVTTAARYLPASEGIDVGGDWYDVIPLSGARVALVIGDVMGHGLSEAATMGRLRTAVRTLADLDFPPAELLTRLNDLVNDLGDSFYATCLYAVYDPVTTTCSFARAGHPPPGIILPGGTVQFPDHSPDPPLGAARPPFETVEVSLPEGSLLVLYTDGLIESPARDIDRGMRHLASALSGAVTVRGGRAPWSGCVTTSWRSCCPRRSSRRTTPHC